MSTRACARARALTFDRSPRANAAGPGMPVMQINPHQHRMVAATALDGNPMVLSRESSYPGYPHFAHCNDPSCSSVDTSELEPHRDQVLRTTDFDLVATAEGLPLIVILRSTEGDIAALECTNVKCHDLPGRPLIRHALRQTLSNLRRIAVAVPADGLPLIIYSTTTHTHFLKCSSAACAGTVHQTNTLASYAPATHVRAGVTGAGNPYMVGKESNYAEVHIYICADVSCSDGTHVNTGITGVLLNSVATTPSGHPAFVVPTASVGPELTLYMCTTPTCDQAQTVTFPGAMYPGLLFGPDGNALVVHSTLTEGELMSTHVNLATGELTVTSLHPGISIINGVTQDKYGMPMIFFERSSIRFIRCSLETCALTVPEPAEG